MLDPNTERLARYKAGLEVAGLKLTGQRAAVCTALASATGHPTVQDIFESAKGLAASISLATVYNTMTALKGLGLVSELVAPDDASTHFELDSRPHANLMCLRCHQVYDVHLPALDGLQEALERNSGFQVADTHVVVTGICSQCQGH